MRLIEKTIDNALFSFNSDSTIVVRVNGEIIIKEVNKENVMDILLDILIEYKIQMEGDDLTILCEDIKNIIDSGLTNDYPFVNLEEGSLHYIGTNLVYKRKEDIYSSKVICKVIKTEDGYINDTYMKMSLMKHDIDVDNTVFNNLVKEIKEYNNEDTTINITRENMQTYIDKVPKEVMCTFLNEYFNRRD